MVAHSNFDPPEVYDQKLNEELDYWLPVIAGIATHEEVSLMTADQLGVAISAAKMKIKLLRKGVDG